MNRNKVIVRPAKGIPCHRKYGYVLQWLGPNKPSWIIGWEGTWAWYKKKSDAKEQAEMWNNSETMKEANKEK